MEYREYGRTGKHVSVIGFGGMRFPPDEEEGVRAMVRACELGINYFDTAPGYCNDRSEPIFGKALPLMPRPVLVSTKSSIDKDPDADAVLSRVDTSLERMGLDTITFFHMWCIMDWGHFERVVAPGGPLDGARKAQQRGLVEHVVFSTHANGEDIARMCETGLFEGVTLGYNLLNHQNRQAGIRAAHIQQMGVVAMNPLGGGMIPAGAERFDTLRDDEDDSVVLAALRFVIAHPGITLALSGMGHVDEVEENVRAAAQVTAPSPQVVEALKGRFSALGETFCTGCNYCQPCPEGIHISSVLKCLHMKELGMERRARGMYALFCSWAGDEWRGPEVCTACGQCEAKCTQHLAIAALMDQAAQEL